MKKKIAIIGSGFSALSAAAYLAKAGNQVTVYEKNSTLGGRDTFDTPSAPVISTEVAKVIVGELNHPN